MEKADIRRLLIANRGEIAVRIIRTCRELGIETVAVFSEADRTAPHVRLADQAHPIGAAPSEASYLNVEAILDAARKSGADAVHPGYGFLSENADFAEACIEAGLRFVGPSPEVIRLMGDKSEARKHVRAAGIPVVPGTEEPVTDDADATAQAAQIGFPVLIKAAAGGGGKGMRLVEEPKDLATALKAARSEAQTAFGDDRVFLEKYLRRPRHVEFQIMADTHGNVVHVFERECSIQRRHQKVIEEAPSTALSPDLRRKMGEAAVAVARSCGYTNTGTIEFLVDEDLNFYFIEVNARLQVEHPVTEWITGIDLVAEQIRIARGEPLSFTQTDLAINGHAIECRVFAEDPNNGFLPDPGTLIRHAAPSGFGVRVDAGIEEGGQVQLHYDPLVSKVIAWGRTRDEARRRMIRALDEYEIAGIHTTIPFCRFVLEHPAFRSGDLSTHFVEEHFSPGTVENTDPEEDKIAALAGALLQEHARAMKTPDWATQPARNVGTSRWVTNRRQW